MTRRQRRARRRREIQMIRKAIRRGVCPCSVVDIADPGPHMSHCEWHPDNVDYDCRNIGPF